MRFSTTALRTLPAALTVATGISATSLSEPTLAQLSPIIVRGEITDEDPPINNQGNPFDVYRVTAEAGTPVTLTLESTAFDTYMVLIFTGEGGSREIARSDNMAPGNTNSQLSGRLPSTGEYTIAMIAADVNGRGAYTLTIDGL